MSGAMSGARLFLSTDANAPVLAGNDDACLVRLLRACLVEGYGDKSPVGWTMPYAGADGRTGVFRNDADHGGLGHYLWVSQFASSKRQWGVRPYESMISESDGLYPYVNVPYYVLVSNTENATLRPWICVATNTWVFLIIYYINTDFATLADVGNERYGTTGFWFGDIDSHSPSDNYHSMFALLLPRDGNGFGNTAAESNSASTTSTFTVNTFPVPAGHAMYTYYRFPRKSDGVGGSPVSHYCYLPHPQSGRRFGNSGPTYNATSGLMVARAALNDAEACTLRGWIPDMLVPMHPRPFANLERVVINDETYVALCFSGANPSGYAVSCCQALFRLAEGE